MSTQSDIEYLQKRLEKLVSLGAKMRVAQNDYFRSKGPFTLNKAKAAEYEFDRMVKEEIKNQKTPQQNLF